MRTPFDIRLASSNLKNHEFFRDYTSGYNQTIQFAVEVAIQNDVRGRILFLESC